MDDIFVEAPRKITRRKRVQPDESVVEVPQSVPSFGASFKPTSKIKAFIDLIQKIKDAQEEFEKLEKDITETKELWIKEQKDYDAKKAEKISDDGLTRKREQQMYEYEISLARKKSEDSFSQKLAEWERDLENSKTQIENDKKELESLRRQANAFNSEIERAIKDANTRLEKELNSKFETETRIKEQDHKAKEDILNLKLATLTDENKKLSSESELMKKSLQVTSDQVKQIAIKVIESSSNQVKNPPVSQNVN